MSSNLSVTQACVNHMADLILLAFEVFRFHARTTVTTRNQEKCQIGRYQVQVTWPVGILSTV